MNLEKMISNPNKVFWPDEGYTKLDVAQYYADVFPKLKPYVDDRLPDPAAVAEVPRGTAGQRLEPGRQRGQVLRVVAAQRLRRTERHPVLGQDDRLGHVPDPAHEVVEQPVELADPSRHARVMIHRNRHVPPHSRMNCGHCREPCAARRRRVNRGPRPATHP